MKLVRILMLITLCLMSSITLASGKVYSPKISYSLEIESNELKKLTEVLKYFAKREKFDFYDVGTKLPKSEVIKPVIGRKPFFIDLRRGDIQIIAQDFSRKNIIELRLYDFGDKNSEYNEFLNLILQLREYWPDKIKEIR